jgi:tight adherence protein B
MSLLIWGFAATSVLAVVMLMWGLSSLWRNSLSSQHDIVKQRWQSLSSAPAAEGIFSLPPTMGSASAWLDSTWQRWPGASAWARFVRQTGLTLAPEHGLLMVGLLLLGSAVAGVLLGLGKVWGSALVVMSLAIPMWFMLHLRHQQMVRIEGQLPEVLDLIARAMQAGHAFTSALQMAANDAKPPLSAQLHKVFDEIHFGLDLRQAMSGLAERIDSDDVRFFVTAVLVQHETGGNLADILRNTATLIRERQKIRGVIRVLSGEGRISAWILSLLPFALAGVLNLVNPEFMSALWTDPKGVQMLYVCVLLMLAGIVWMWRLIDIRI